MQTVAGATVAGATVAEGNANPQKDVTQEYDVPPATRRLIERNNEQDLEIYARGKRHLARLEGAVATGQASP